MEPNRVHPIGRQFPPSPFAEGIFSSLGSNSKCNTSDGGTTAVAWNFNGRIGEICLAEQRRVLRQVVGSRLTMPEVRGVLSVHDARAFALDDQQQPFQLQRLVGITRIVAGIF